MLWILTLFCRSDEGVPSQKISKSYSTSRIIGTGNLVPTKHFLVRHCLLSDAITLFLAIIFYSIPDMF